MFCRNASVKIILKTINSVQICHRVALLNNYAYNRNDSNRKRTEDLVGMALERISIERPQDWHKVKEFVLHHELNRNRMYNSGNIDGMIMGCCVSRLKRADLAKTYLKYLEEQNIKPNLATIGRYLKLLYNNNIEKKTKDEEKEILQLCKDIEQANPILDSLTQENMILALSLTKEWRRCLDLLQDVKITANPANSTYSALIAAAFLNKEENLAWDLLKEMLDNKKQPSSVVFKSYLKTLKRLKKQESIVRKLENLFQFFNESEIMCQEDVVKSILEIYKNSGSATTVNFSGCCDSCKTNLKKFELTENEFSELKETVLKNAIVGTDIFIKSNPKEMADFKNFVSNMGKFDVVLDGLNIAYSAGINKGPHVFSKRLAAVISYFVDQNKSVLMLGRIHMKRWPRNNWDYITKNSTVFLTQNISQDDPYLLYCALHSGKDTTIVTRDLMRSHKFLLKERKHKILFDRWLSQKQYHLLHINEQNKAFFRVPPPFSPVAQRNGSIWHIPYIPESDNSINEKYHKSWLCLDFSK